MGAFDISAILGAATPRVRVAAVGAMFIGEGEEPQDALMAKGLCEVIGFEPVPEECARLNARYGPAHRYLPQVVGDGRPRTFHRTNAPMTSSLYPPNERLLRRFSNLAELFVVEGRDEVETARLDDLPEVGDIDLLKIDVQGGELEVFAGASRVLREAMIVHTEVSFVPMYEGQALFGDVDTVLRRAGFLFHRFDGEPHGRAIRPLVSSKGPHAPLSQVLWADAVYVRDFTRLEALPSRKRLALATLLHESYRSYDLCAYVLHVQDKVNGSDFWAPYITRLTGAPPPERLED